jgi:broad specificity phosphatase PhoE
VWRVWRPVSPFIPPQPRPVHRSWRLNERHYGAVQARRRPGSISLASERAAIRGTTPELVPRSECLKDVVQRMLRYWYHAIVPDVAAGKLVLVAAHGNSLRALVKHLDGISDEAIAKLNLPTVIPIVYHLDTDCTVITLGDRCLDPDAAAESARRWRSRDGEIAAAASAASTFTTATLGMAEASTRGRASWAARSSAHAHQAPPVRAGRGDRSCITPTRRGAQAPRTPLIISRSGASHPASPPRPRASPYAGSRRCLCGA